ncbi:procollagen-lysine,2-oxoglutarate 5-dioxygenase 1-like isoform X3 [Branchiostoma lanceolatum]|uniref:procollagen-lysine,2-oxoglutarate 5-dioxygenase 1-like isoform X3 n=1 Tax=Branchiostoma lanceolatum TaxID=7740 RepID=UPI003456C7F7
MQTTKKRTLAKMAARQESSTLAGLFCVVFLLLCRVSSGSSSQEERKFVTFTVATDETDGFKRFMRSADRYNIQVQVLGMHQEWLGGDVQNTIGGGQKVLLLKEALKKYKDEKDLVIMFSDSYDVIITADKKEILRKFDDFNARVVFGAEGFCWPDRTLADLYPEVRLGKPYLNSGGFIGYASELYQIVSHTSIQNQHDDQLYYTRIFLNPELREKFKMKLDHTSEIFQNMNGAGADLTLKFEDDKTRLRNRVYNTEPCIIHGNGPQKLVLNAIGNYVADSWSFEGCHSCKENTFSLKTYKRDDYPVVVIGLFIEQPTPFVPEFLNKIYNLDYPKNKIVLFIHNHEEHHASEVEEFVKNYGGYYKAVREVGPGMNMNQWYARKQGLSECIGVKCDYYLSVDADVQIANPKTLQILIEQNRSVIAPMATKYGKLWSNFWGAIGDDGFYARSDDYIDIVQGTKKGVWNVPYINNVYLIHGSLLQQPKTMPSFIVGQLDADMAFCASLREKGIFMYVTNMETFGRLTTTTSYSTEHLHPDMWQMYDNRPDWEEKYIHPDFYKMLDPKTEVEMPCPDVYWFPIVTETFCKHLVEEMENYGEWSGGKNEDPRLSNGYENVPTVDIHMNQIGYEREWLHFLKEFVTKLQEKVYPGYYSEAQAIMNFVVRYHPQEQPFLRPHHDSSTFTINLALNKAGVDFEGGGCRFLRYNCSVTNTKMGWLLMHPGRLTHYHEGLPTTNGTRYILISFVDP